MTDRDTAATVDFGPFRLDPSQHVLLRDGARVALTPKAVDLLCVLVRHAGRVVGKDSLLRAVWPDTVVEEGNLARLVFVLRRELGATPEGRAYIETVPKRGYRFAAPLRAVAGREEGRRLAAAGPDGEGGAAPGRAVAVLPFADLSARGDQQHFCEGIGDEIINALGRLPGLRVVGRMSSFRYAGQPVDAREIGRQLDVAAVVHGSLRKAGRRVRITAQLIDAGTGYQLWSEMFDRTVGDLFAIQAEIAAVVAGRLARERPASPGPPTLPPTRDMQAYELYLQGRYLFSRRPGKVVWDALRCFARAAKRDPGFAAAWAGMADVYSTLGSWEAGVLPHGKAQARAKTLASRALAIDPGLAEAHTTLAYTALHHDWDQGAAEEGFRRALALQPGYSAAHHWYSHCLGASGRVEESLAESRLALLFDPMNLLMNAHLAWHFRMAREPERVIEQSERVIGMDPGFHWGHFFLGWGAEGVGDFSRAVTAFRRAVRCSDGNPVMQGGLGRALGLAGDVRRARAIARDLLRRGASRFAYEVGLIHLALDEQARALDYFIEARRHRSGWMAYLAVDPRVDPLRADPRFRALIEDATPGEGSAASRGHGTRRRR